MKTAAKDFKMTELGSIPKDWEVVPLGDLFSFKNGYNAPAGCYGKGMPVASVLEALDWVPLTRPRIRGKVDAPAGAQKDFALRSGDLIFTRSSETLEDVGRANVYVDETPSMFGGFVIRGRPKTNNDSRFINYLLKNPAHRERVMSKGAGAQHYNIGQTGLSEVMVALPPPPEQRKIAAALSDVDEMIAALEKLIEKKRKIKIGAMQRLLTGKTRLPGFKGAWVEKRLGDVGDFVAGNGFPLRWQGVLKGDYPFFKVSDFSNVGNERRMRVANNYISTDVVRILNCCLVPKFSIVFAKIGAAIALERKRLLMQTSCIDNNMMAFIAGDEVCSEFMVELFQEIKFADFSESTALPALNIGRLREVVVSCPPILAEQKAIAKVLGDIDEEIAALEAELAKTRQLKQGMMQELLTGKTRLI